MTEQNLWEQTFALHDEQKKEQEEAKNNAGSYDFEEVSYEGLAIDKAVIFRMDGNPMEYRQLPTDAKLVLQTKMVKDGEKGRARINWKYIESKGKYVIDPDWILSKLYNKVMDRTFVKYTEADVDGKEITKQEDGTIKNKRGHTGAYQDIHTDKKVYNRLKYNKLPSDKKSFGDAYPSTRIVMNVISRMDDWCKTEKHTKILATKVGISEKVNDKGEKVILTFPDTGISKSMYDEFLGYFRSIGSIPPSTDLVVTRTHINDKYSQTIFDGEGLIKLERGAPDVISKIVSGPITEEEKAYERYDLDKLFSVSSYVKIKKNLSALFKEYDSEFEDNLYDELCALALEEEKQKTANSTTEEEKVVEEKVASETVSTPTVTVEDKVEAEEPKVERKPREVVQAESTVDFSIFPFWNEIPEEDRADMKKFVVSVASVDEVVFAPGTAIIPCSDCGKPLPNTVLTCPFCKAALA